MFPELPTCSPFANKVPLFKPRLSWKNSSTVIWEHLSWNYHPTTQRPSTEVLRLIWYLHSAPPYGGLHISFCSSAFPFSFSITFLSVFTTPPHPPSLRLEKNLFLYEVTFSYNSSNIVHTSCHTRGQKWDTSRRDRLPVQTGQILTLLLFFLVEQNQVRKIRENYKWRKAEGMKERGRYQGEITLWSSWCWAWMSSMLSQGALCLWLLESIC